MHISDKLDQVVSLLEQAQKENLGKTKTAAQDARNIVRQGIYKEAKKASYTEALWDAYQRGAF